MATTGEAHGNRAEVVLCISERVASTPASAAWMARIRLRSWALALLL